MTIRQFYIAAKDTATGSIHAFKDAHWIDLPNGLVLVSATFHNDVQQDAWENHPLVQPLPHMLDTSPVNNQHIQLLAGIGAKPGDKTKDIRAHAKAHHPLM